MYSFPIQFLEGVSDENIDLTEHEVRPIHCIYLRQQVREAGISTSTQIPVPDPSLRREKQHFIYGGVQKVVNGNLYALQGFFITDDITFILTNLGKQPNTLWSHIAIILAAF